MEQMVHLQQNIGMIMFGIKFRNEPDRSDCMVPCDDFVHVRMNGSVSRRIESNIARRYHCDKTGFTLIETLIYVLIFSMMVGVLAGFASNLETFHLRTQVMLEVHDQGSSL